MAVSCRSQPPAASNGNGAKSTPNATVGKTNANGIGSGTNSPSNAANGKTVANGHAPMQKKGKNNAKKGSK